MLCIGCGSLRFLVVVCVVLCLLRFVLCCVVRCVVVACCVLFSAWFVLLSFLCFVVFALI